MMKVNVKLFVEADYLAISVFINGIEVYIDDYNNATTRQMLISQYLKYGQNEVSVCLRSPLNQCYQPPIERFALRVVEFGQSNGVIVDKILLEDAWVKSRDALFPIWLHKTFQFFENPYVPIWEAAERLSEGSNTDEIAERVSFLWDAMSNGNYEKLWKAFEIKYEHYQKSIMLSDDVIFRQRESLKEMVLQKNFLVKPLDWGNVYYKLMPNQRILKVLHLHRDDFLETEFIPLIDARFALPLYFSKINSVWELVL